MIVRSETGTGTNHLCSQNSAEIPFLLLLYPPAAGLGHRHRHHHYHRHYHHYHHHNRHHHRCHCHHHHILTSILFFICSGMCSRDGPLERCFGNSEMIMVMKTKITMMMMGMTMKITIMKGWLDDGHGDEDGKDEDDDDKGKGKGVESVLAAWRKLN